MALHGRQRPRIWHIEEEEYTLENEGAIGADLHPPTLIWQRVLICSIQGAVSDKRRKCARFMGTKSSKVRNMYPA